MHHEITIIGGGPAGSTVAIYLAEYGYEVCLIEKKIFPRDVLCGEFLSREVVNNLKELNLFSEFLNLKPNSINSFAFFADKKGISTQLGFQAYSLKRSAFDDLLLKNAKSKGVTVYQPYDVLEIGKENNSYKLSLKSSVQSSKVISSKYVIAAYGKRNNLDSKLNRKFILFKSNLNGIKYHVHKSYLNNIEDNQIQIYADDAIYCGVNSVTDDEVTFCLLEDRQHFLGTSMQSLKNLADRNEKFQALFNSKIEAAFKSNKVYGAGNIYFGRRNKVESGMFMIGDAAQVIAPLAGDGISMAMDSAKLLADLFWLKKQKNISDNNLCEMYNREWQKSFERRLKTAVFIQNVLFKKIGRKISLSSLRYFPQALNYFIKNTRG
jgi:flavin-dependent dehydrogenase